MVCPWTSCHRIIKDNLQPTAHIFQTYIQEMSFGSTYSNNPRRIHSYLFFSKCHWLLKGVCFICVIYPCCVRVQRHLEFVRRKELQVKLSMDRELLALPNHWFPPLAQCLAWKPLNYRIIEPWNGLEGTLKVISSLSFQLFLLNRYIDIHRYIYTEREKEIITGMLCSREMQSITQTGFLQLSKTPQNLPCSPHHDCLCPGLHDLYEGAVVKEPTQPLPFLV